MSENDDFVSLMLRKSKEKEKTEVFRPLAPKEEKPENSSIALSNADVQAVENFVKKMKEQIK